LTSNFSQRGTLDYRSRSHVSADGLDLVPAVGEEC